jgi:hypothetical protein
VRCRSTGQVENGSSPLAISRRGRCLLGRPRAARCRAGRCSYARRPMWHRGHSAPAPRVIGLPAINLWMKKPSMQQLMILLASASSAAGWPDRSARQAAGATAGTRLRAGLRSWSPLSAAGIGRDATPSG